MKLILYHFETCPYCERVRETVDRLKISEIEYRDILKTPAYREELIRINGTRQVPCLLIDGKPMLESADIIRFLEQNFGS